MKRKTSLLIVVMVALAVLSSAAALAQTPQPPVDAPAQGDAPRQYILWLETPDLSAAPRGISPKDAASFVAEAIREQAQPTLDELHALQQSGQVASFALLPDRNAISVMTGVPDVVQSLDRVADLSRYQAFSPIPSCAPGYMERLEAEALRSGRTVPPPDNTQATNPSIDVFTYNGRVEVVQGRTTSNALVTLRVLRQGQVVATDSTTSSEDGIYSIYNDWTGGCNGHYEWEAHTGDIIEVTAGGSTITTEVVDMIAWANTFSNVVGGIAQAPGRYIDIHLYSVFGRCEGLTPYTVSTGLDALGNFAYDFSSQVDFKGQSYAYAYARDANGNSTYVGFDAFYIYAEGVGSDYAYGMIQPDDAYTVTLTRGASVIETFTGQTSSNGFFFIYPSNLFQAGDVIRVVGTGVDYSYTVAPLTLITTPGSNQILGTTAPGRYVIANIYGRYQCSGAYCLTATANGSGNFSLPLGFTFRPGDYGYFYVYDAQGNYQYQRLYSRVIAAYLNYDSARGYWDVPYTDVTANLYDQSHSLKDSQVDATSSSGAFYTYFDVDMEAGDILEVGNGVMTETMTIQALNGTLNNNTERIAGVAPNGPLVVKLYDFRPETGYYYYDCRELTVSGEAFNIDYSNFAIGATDDANIYSRDTNGNVNYRYLQAASANVNLYSGNAWGYTLSPNTNVHGEAWNGSSLLDSFDGVSSETDSSYYGDFDQPLQAGNRLLISSDLFFDITLPILTIAGNANTQTIEGQAPANSLVEAGVWVDYWCGKDGWCSDSFSNQVSTDASGNYSTAFIDEYIYTDFGCIDVTIGNNCVQPYVSYYRPDGNEIRNQTPPQYSLPDAYEDNDDSFNTAPAYSGRTTHTFDAYEDQDWVVLPVSADMVGQSVRIFTTHLGQMADTVLTLYGPDDSYTQVATNDDRNSATLESELYWTPSAAGMYYLKVSPYEYSGGRCDSSYDLVIYLNSYQTFLPLTSR